MHATCATQADAEREAQGLLSLIGGGEVLIYDAYLRLHAVKRFSSGAQDGE